MSKKKKTGKSRKSKHSKQESPLLVQQWSDWASLHITYKRILIASWFIVAFICAIYILRTSGVVLFRGGDNAHYILLAKALAEGHGYVDLFKAQLTPHTQYPPLFPALLSAVTYLKGMDSYLMNLVVSLSMVATIIVLFILLRKEKFASPLLPVVWFPLWISTFYFTDSILTEPTYMALSLAALLFMERWMKKQSILYLCIAVVLCWISVMTRTAGITLIAAMAAGVFVFRGISKKSALRAISVLIICSLPLILWSLRNSMLGETSTNYLNQFLLANPGKPSEGYLSIFSLSGRIWDNFKIHFMDLSGTAGMKSMGLVSGVFLLLGVTGFVQRVRQGISTPEFYTIFYIGLILIWPFANVRFMIPIYPLIIAYIVHGAVFFVKKIPAAELKAAASTAAIIVFLAIITANGIKVNEYYQESREHYSKHKVQSGNKLYLCATSSAYHYMLKASVWLRNHGESGAIVMGRKPRLIALASNYPVVGVPREAPANPAEWLKEQKVKYIILDELYPNVSKFLKALQENRNYYSRIRLLHKPSEKTAVLSAPLK